MFPTVGPFARHLGGDSLALGLAVAAYSVSNLLFNVLGGVLLDRSGRRRFLVGGLIAAALAMGLYNWTNSVNSLLMVRFLHGAAGGILVPAVFTMLADVAPVKGRGQAMGRAGALIGGAAIIAPAVAGILRQVYGFHAVFLAGFSVLITGSLMAAFLTPETGIRSVNGEQAKLQDEPGPHSKGSSEAWRLLTASYWSIFTLTFAMGALTAFLPETVESLGYGASLTGLMFALFGLVAAVLMMSPLSQSVDRHGMLKPVAIGLLLVVIGLAFLASARGIALIGLAVVIFGAGYGIIFPSTSAQIALASSVERRGRAYGIFYACFSLGVIAGAPIGGLFLSPTPLVGSPFFPALILTLTAIPITAILARKPFTFDFSG